MKLLDYQFTNIEKNKNDFWVKNKFFHFDKSSKKEKFFLVIPPPNITGVLHIGHAWNLSIQDALIRFKKLNDFNVCWLPAMDHAGIATQIKIEKQLWDEKSILKKDISRKEFLKYADDYQKKFYQQIKFQWSKLGLALDYSKIHFTLNQDFQKGVNLVFKKLYDEKLLYRDYRIVYWDVKLQTALSDIQIEHVPKKGKLYYFKYYLEDRSDYLSVATTRPETMFADVCLFVNPKDKRYLSFYNKKVYNPVNKNLIPVYQDKYVSQDFGSGVMKCTPGHDINDYELGKKYFLNFKVCLTKDAKLNELGGKYKGQDRFVCRDNLIKDLTKLNLIDHIEDHNLNIAHSVRSKSIVELILSKQWFVKMANLANEVLKFQKSDKKTIFYPANYEKTLKQWLKNIQDWCISRQIWWGHQIPVWYHKNDSAKIQVGIKPKNLDNYFQDKDVLDTWFSSALWPLIANGWPNNNYNLLPLDVMVTGYDIIFFWITRMMMQGIKFNNASPFSNVLIHGLIRDEKNRKMSKSLNNGVDPLEIIKNYGNDSLRLFLLTNAKPGNDLKYSESKIKASSHFINKVWNSAKYVQLKTEDFKFNINEIKKNIQNIKFENNSESLINYWILTKIMNLKKEFYYLFNDKFDLSLAFQILSKTFLNNFCDWYIELSKILLEINQSSQVKNVKSVLKYCLHEFLLILHPFMPFVTEEIYQHLFNTSHQKSILQEQYNFNDLKFLLKQKPLNFTSFNTLQSVIIQIRKLRFDHQISKTQVLYFDIKNKSESNIIFINQFKLFFQKLVNIQFSSNDLNLLEKNNKLLLPCDDLILILNKNIFINQKEHILLLKKKLNDINLEIKRSKLILNNKNFLAKANPIKIKLEKDKYQNYLAKQKAILKSIKNT